MKGNILSYIEWRGDLTFSKSAFNEVDNLIFSMLAYFDFEGLVPAPGMGEISLQAAAKRYFASRELPEAPEEASNSGKTLQWLLHIMSNSRRYQQLKLSAAVDVLDRENATQFYAICIHMGKKKTYLAFRGTDDNLAGWKEDFLLACTPEIPSQREALRYVEQVAGLYPSKALMLGGHSKGGNLAVYAAAFVPEELQRHIMDVWSNDGPGFQEAMLASEGYRRIAPRIHHIVPKSSVVGMLLAHDEHYKIVDSSQVGLLQHDGFSWGVSGNHFVEISALTAESIKADHTIRNWLQTLSQEEREQFVDYLFDILYASGATTLSEVRRDKLKSFISSLPRAREIPKDTRDRIIEFLLMLRQIIRRLGIESRLEKMKSH